MAESAVKFQIFANAQAAEKAILELQKKFLALENSLTQVSRKSKKASGDTAGMLQQLGSFATSAIARFGGVAAAGSAVASSVLAIKKEFEQATEASRLFGKAYLTSMAQAGRLAEAPEVRTMLQGLVGVTEEQAGAIHGGVIAGSPFMSKDRAAAMTAAVSKLSVLLAPTEPGKVSDTGNLSTFAGFAAELGDAFPNKSAGDITDLAWSAFQKSGGKAARLDSAAFERALGPLSEKFGAEGALSRVVTALDAGIDPRGMAAKGALDKLDPAKIAAMEQQFLNAQTGDIVARDLRLATGADPTTMLNQFAAARQQAELRQKAQAEAMQDAIEETTRPVGWAGAGHRVIESGAEAARFAFGSGPGPNDPGVQPWLQDVLTKQLAAMERAANAMEEAARGGPRVNRTANSE